MSCVAQKNVTNQRAPGLALANRFAIFASFVLFVRLVLPTERSL